MTVSIIKNMEDYTKLLSDSNILYVIKIGATWCSHCRKYKPIFEEVASEYENNEKVDFYDADSDNRDLSDFFTKQQIEYLPTTLFIKNGEVLDKTTGAKTKVDLKARIQNLI